MLCLVFVFVTCGIQACCSSSSAATVKYIKPPTTPQVSQIRSDSPSAVVSSIDIYRTKKYIDSYKSMHPTEVAALRSIHNRNESKVNDAIINKHLRSSSRHIEEMKPAMTHLLGNE